MALTFPSLRCSLADLNTGIQLATSDEKIIDGQATALCMRWSMAMKKLSGDGKSQPLTRLVFSRSAAVVSATSPPDLGKEGYK